MRTLSALILAISMIAPAVKAQDAPKDEPSQAEIEALVDRVLSERLEELRREIRAEILRDLANKKKPAEKPAPKKAEPKKAEPKKPEPKKPEPKKAEPKKAEPKKAEPKKAEPKAKGPAPWVHLGSTWRYYDGQDMPKGWQAPAFDDSKWKSGRALLGYGDQDIRTGIGFGEDERDKHLVAYFRSEFEIESLEGAKEVVGRIICDDAAAIWVNGVEVHRENLRAGIPIGPRTGAAGESPYEREAWAFVLAAKHFKKGKNTIAVSVHQWSPTSSDLAFGLVLRILDPSEKAELKKKIKLQKLLRLGPFDPDGEI